MNEAGPASGGHVAAFGTPRMLNPLRSEDEAFRALLWVLAVAAVVVAVVLAARALT